MSSRPRATPKRLISELETWKREAEEEPGIERIGPVADDDLLRWEAVINGRGIGHGYDCGRWLVAIDIPSSYPLQPPRMRFVTPVVHANVALGTGEICLDLLADAWTAAYTVPQCVRAVRMLLANPGVDSPLNIEVAALLRAGDDVAARALVELWCLDERGRYDGP